MCPLQCGRERDPVPRHLWRIDLELTCRVCKSLSDDPSSIHRRKYSLKKFRHARGGLDRCPISAPTSDKRASGGKLSDHHHLQLGVGRPRPHRPARAAQDGAPLGGHWASRQPPPGVWHPLPPENELAPLLDASGQGEIIFLLDALHDSGFVKRRNDEDPSGEPDGDGGWTKNRTVYLVTPKGWEALMPGGTGRVGTCFVAMAFDPALDDVYSGGIQPAVEKDCGMSVLRVDKVQHNESINDQIIVGLRTAQFVVADNHQRNGVYFEGGYTMGLGRPVIWTVRADDVKNVHFDTSHLNHIVWNDAADLRTKLALRIQATIPGK